MAEIDNLSEIIEETSLYYYNKKKKKLPGVPAQEHKLIYDSFSEELEPVYFWILDMMNDLFKGNVEKLIDNFTSSPGSGHFAELGARATRMQEQGMKMLGSVNTVIKSIINLIYDLKEFQIRLKHYEACKSRKKEEKEAGLLALKQIWMDNVDIKRGRGSINMLTAEMMFSTLRDAFMVAKSVKDVDKMDLNDRVKRILKPRVAEFLEWKKRSEAELKKRYEIERAYLKSQVGALKLYTRWTKPYLRAAAQLEMKETKRPALVTVFNTMLLELALFGKNEVDVKEEAIEEKSLPLQFSKVKLRRKYYSCILVDFYFRGVPRRISPQQAHYTFGGRTEVTFKAYALNDDELKLLEKRLAESDINDALKLVEQTTGESLEQLREDIEYFLKEENEEKEEKKTSDVNPFAALLGLYEKKEKSEKKEEEKQGKKKTRKIRKDNYVESVVRKLAEKNARETCFKIFDVYKKAHAMPSHPEPEFE